MTAAQALGRGGDGGRLRNEGLLQRIAGSNRGVRAAEANDGGLEGGKGFFRHHGRNFGTDPAQSVGFMHNDQTAGFRHRGQNRRGIQRFQAAQIDDLRREPLPSTVLAGISYEAAQSETCSRLMASRR